LESGAYQAIRNRSSFIRRYLIQKFGERCSRCGWAERHPITGNIPVELEHIDGDWQNNQADNLTLLCPNCHSLTATYRALNRGKGRAHRLGGRGEDTAPKAKPETFREALKVIEPRSKQLRLL
jgi:5-methylcytosine-specific restriction endonuclease McrA